MPNESPPASDVQPSNNERSLEYCIALQRAIEHHCKGLLVPIHIADRCPHHAEMLNRRWQGQYEPAQCCCGHMIDDHKRDKCMICGCNKFRIVDDKPAATQLQYEVAVESSKDDAPPAVSSTPATRELPTPIEMLALTHERNLRVMKDNVTLRQQVATLTAELERVTPKVVTSKSIVSFPRDHLVVQFASDGQIMNCGFCFGSTHEGFTYLDYGIPQFPEQLERGPGVIDQGAGKFGMTPSDE